MATLPRKTWIMLILDILERYSDEEHPLTQQKIINLLKAEHKVSCERKSVSRNIVRLREMGYNIHSDRNGSYLVEKDFTDSELRLLIDSVMCSRHINPKHSSDLIKKLVELGGVGFRGHIKHLKNISTWNKSCNLDFFLNVEIFEEAISGGKQVSFYYNKFGIDKKLHKKSNNKRIVNPYQMILHNQRYYLVGNDSRYNDLIFYRISKITEPELLCEPSRDITSLPGYEKGLNLGKITACLPYLYVDATEEVVIKCENWMVDEIVDWFGLDFEVKKVDDKQIEVTIHASRRAMRYWLLQYGEHVEVIVPLSLRENIKDTLLAISKKYDTY